MVHLKSNQNPIAIGTKKWMILSGVLLFISITQTSLLAQEQVDKITVDPMGMNLVVGEQGTFFVKVFPEQTGRKLIWSSSEPEYFSVDENGVVTALAPINSFPPPYVTVSDASGKLVARGYVVVLSDTEVEEDK